MKAINDFNIDKGVFLDVFNEVTGKSYTVEDVRSYIPGFANGGFNPGGLSIVGERGPELSYRPPSQIMSNSDMMSALSNEFVVEKLVELINVVSKGNFAIAKNTQDSAKTLKKFDYDGMPEQREEAA